MGAQQKEQRQRGGALRTFAVFSLGAAAGSIAALLAAPASGTVTRKRLGQQVRKLQKTAARRISQTRKVLITRADDVRETASEKLIDARKWMVNRMSNGHAPKRPARRGLRHAHA